MKKSNLLPPDAKQSPDQRIIEHGVAEMLRGAQSFLS